MDTKKLRQKILDLAIHGKLVPQDPNDEPASVLLERIRAEKEQLIKEGKIKAPKKSKSAGDTSHYPKDVPWELPEGWEWCKITDVVDKLTDGTHNSPKSYPSGVYMYVTAKNIKRAGLDLSNITYVDKDVHREIYARCNPEKGDILYIKDGATCGISTINNLNVEFSLLSSVALIKPNKNILNTYLNLFLQSEFCYRNVRDSMKGVGITRIILKQMELWDIPLPPFAEQKRIVAAAEQLLQITDVVEDEQTMLGQTIKKTKERILDIAIHGKLVPQAPSEEPAINLLKRINPNFTPSDNLHYEGELPNGWCFSTIGDLFRHNTGKALNGKDQVGEELRYITTSNLYWDRFDLNEVRTMPFTEAEKEKCRATKGDLLVCEGGDVGRAAIWPHDFDVMIQNHIHRLRPREDISVRFYYYIFLLYKQMGLIGGKGIAILGLSSRELDKMVVPVPPVPEQHRIVTVIENLFAQMDALISNLS